MPEETLFHADGQNNGREMSITNDDHSKLPFIIFWSEQFMIEGLHI